MLLSTYYKVLLPIRVDPIMAHIMGNHGILLAILVILVDIT